MKNIRVGDNVWVPARRIGLESEAISALVERPVTARNERTVTVSLPDGTQTPIATKLVHPSAGVAVFRIGDLGVSEQTLLDPLAKTILQFSRLLLPDDFVRLFEVRSLTEMDSFWNAHQGEFRHVVLVGHGRQDAVRFGSTWVDAEAVSKVLLLRATEMKVVISLCCKTGLASFGKEFSNRRRAEAFIAPLKSIHGADAATFVQLFICQALLDGATTTTAFKRAEKGIGRERDFRMWKHGNLVSL